MENKGNIKIINLKKDKGVPYDLYIGRKNGWLNLPRSKWENPFVMQKESERAEVLLNYRNHIESRPDLIRSLQELTGKTLACYCCNYSDGQMVGKVCHGIMLIELYDKYVK